MTAGPSLPPPPAPRTVYLNGAPDTVCAVLHSPAELASRDTAVILVPPFGWDEVCSYRSRRCWAQRLAMAGYPCVRLTLPSTGDSGGMPRDPERVEAWSAAVTTVAQWTRTALGAQRVAAIGIGLGGLIAYRAAAAEQIEDLVLWATPARGRALVRELRAFSRLEASEFFAPTAELRALPDGELIAGGFLLAAQTVEQLERLELAAMPLPSASSARVLLLGRDGIAVDEQLGDELRAGGLTVTLAAGNGYAAMTAPPQQAQAPLDVIEHVSAWLDERSAAAPGAESTSAPADLRAESSSAPADLHAESSSAPADLRAGPSGHVQMPDGTAVREMGFRIEQPFGALAGVLAQPPEADHAPVCLVLLNAGAIPHLGPGRMWVELARRWAARGLPSLRLDIEGIGDADGDPAAYTDDAALYTPELVPQVIAALDALQDRGVAERFVLAGLCSGAYWSFQAALRDHRVTAVCLLNPRALRWDPWLGAARDFRRAVLRPSNWRRIPAVANRARLRALVLWLLTAPKRGLARLRLPDQRAAANRAPLDEAFDRLREDDKRVLILFSENEPLHEELVSSGHFARLERWPNMALELIPGRDHTLRPLLSQERAHEALDRALARELRRALQPAAPALDLA